MNAYILTNCVISLAILVFVCFFQFKRLSRDDFRSDIRRLRDELFDYMWKNGYSFDDPGYRGTRRVLNGLLRLSNHATPIKFIAAAVQCQIAKHHGVVYANPIPPAKQEDLQAKIDEVCGAATGRFMRFVFLEGPRGWIMRMLIIYPSRVIRLLARLKDRIRRDGPRFLVQQGYICGSTELSPEERSAFNC